MHRLVVFLALVCTAYCAVYVASIGWNNAQLSISEFDQNGKLKRSQVVLNDAFPAVRVLVIALLSLHIAAFSASG